MPRYSPQQMEICRTELGQRFPRVLKSLRESLPDARLSKLMPNEYGVACVLTVGLLHQKGNRILDFGSSDGALLGNLSDTEKSRIGEAVGKATSEAGLDCTLAWRESTNSRLVYKVFWRIQ